MSRVGAREAASVLFGIALVVELVGVLVNAERSTRVILAAGAEFAGVIEAARRPRWRDRVSRRVGAITVRTQQQRARQRQTQLVLPLGATLP